MATNGTSTLVRNVFAEIHILYPNFMTFDHFFEEKKFRKLEKKSEKIHMYSDKLRNQF